MPHAGSHFNSRPIADAASITHTHRRADGTVADPCAYSLAYGLTHSHTYTYADSDTCRNTNGYPDSYSRTDSFTNGDANTHGSATGAV